MHHFWTYHSVYNTKKLKKIDFQDLFAENPIEKLWHQNKNLLSEKMEFLCYEYTYLKESEKLSTKLRASRLTIVFGMLRKNWIFKSHSQKNRRKIFLTTIKMEEMIN